MSDSLLIASKPVSSVPLYVLTALRQWCMELSLLPYYCQDQHWSLGMRYLHHISSGLEATLRGVSTYMHAPYKRYKTPSMLVLKEGSTELRDYAPQLPETSPAMLIVPSLLNRAYIFDLMENHSTVAFLASHGIRPLMIEWGVAEESEYGFACKDYCARIAKMIERCGKDQPLTVMGYCMGGLLALAASMQQAEHVRKLILLATPWDFHQGELYPLMHQLAQVGALDHGSDPLPPQLIQTLFSDLDPQKVQQKFITFSKMPKDSAEFNHFMAVEHWLHDMLPMTKPLAQECFSNMFMENVTLKGQWIVNPKDCTIPTHSIIPTKDYIVPRASSECLAQALPLSTITTCPSGHIGMLVGRSAKSHLWPILAGES